MPLAVCSDLSPADWIVASDIPWPQLVTIGPSGFAACARWVIPDATHEVQRESEADLDATPDEVDPPFRQPGAGQATRIAVPEVSPSCAATPAADSVDDRGASHGLARAGEPVEVGVFIEVLLGVPGGADRERCWPSR